MTDSHTVEASGDQTERARRLAVPVAIAAAVVPLAVIAAWVWGDSADDEVGEILIICGLIAIAVGVVFGLVVPRTLGKESVGSVALTLSVLGAVSAVVFWAGVTPALAAGGALLGWSGRDVSKGRNLSMAALVVGLLALLAYVAIVIGDWNAS